MNETMASSSPKPEGRKRRDVDEVVITLVTDKAPSQGLQQNLDQELQTLIKKEHVENERFGQVKKSIQYQNGKASIVYKLSNGGAHCAELLKLAGESVGYSKVVNKAVVNCGGHSSDINKN